MIKRRDLSEQINFNNSSYYFKSESGPINCIGFKGPLGFLKNIRDDYATPENTKKIKKVFKSYLNVIAREKWEHKSEKQKGTIQNIKTLQITRRS